jgi:hypothetical protein
VTHELLYALDDIRRITVQLSEEIRALREQQSALQRAVSLAIGPVKETSAGDLATDTAPAEAFLRLMQEIHGYWSTEPWLASEVIEFALNNAEIDAAAVRGALMEAGIAVNPRFEKRVSQALGAYLHTRRNTTLLGLHLRALSKTRTGSVRWCVTRHIDSP